MDQFNKVFSFILGLVVVVVFIAFASGKINLGNKKPLFSGLTGTKVTPTVTPTPASKTIVSLEQTETNPSKSSSESYHSYVNPAAPKTIPNTGAPTLLLPFAFSSLMGGFFLKGKGKKKD